MTPSDKPERSVRLDYFGGTSGTYAGFDRFGRVIDHRWYDYDATPGDVERLTHGYDYNSNRLYRGNEVNHSFDELYHADGSANGYDGLNRLVEFRRGSLNANKDTVSSLSVAQKWALKALGNWSTFQQDANGDGSYSETVDLDQTRTHNTANEITDIGEATGQAQWATPGYDARGNMTSIPRVVTIAAYTGSYGGQYRVRSQIQTAGMIRHPASAGTWMDQLILKDGGTDANDFIRCCRPGIPGDASGRRPPRLRLLPPTARAVPTEGPAGVYGWT